MPRIVYDISITMSNKFNSGIQRVVLNLAKEIFENPEFKDCELTVVIRNQKIFGKKEFLIVDTETLNQRIGLTQRDNDTPFSTKEKTLSLIRRSNLLSKALDSTLIFAGFRRYQDWRGFRNFIIHSKKTQRKFTFSAGDTYLTADAFWTRSSVVARIRSLKRAGVKIAILVHDIFPVTNPEWFYSSDVKIFRRNFPKVINEADFLFSVSSFTAKEVLGSYPSAVRAKVIRMGMARVESLKDVPNLSLDAEENLIFVGTLEPRKNYEQILEWLTIIDWQGQVNIFGRKGWKSEGILLAINEARQKGLDIVWHENATDFQLRGFINSKTIGVCASLSEGYGLPLREFRTIGIGVVASRIPAFVEGDIDQGVRFFDLTDISSFREALNDLRNREAISRFIYPTWKESLQDILMGIKSNAI